MGGQESQGNDPENNGLGGDSTCLSAWYKAVCNISYYYEINYIWT